MRRNSTNYLVGMLLLLRVVLNFCNQHSNNFKKAYWLWVVEAKGYLVPNDCIARTNIISRKNPSVGPITVNKILAAQINLETIGKPESIFSTKSKVFKPALDGFLRTKQVPVIDLLIYGELHSVVTVKKLKTAGCQNFSPLNKLFGYNTLVKDKGETSWLSTKGGSVSKYKVELSSLIRPNNCKVKFNLKIKQG